MPGKFNLLLLCNRPARGSNADTIEDHLNALNSISGFNVYELSTVKVLPAKLDLDLFDVVVIHYTLQLGEPNDHFLSPIARAKLRECKAIKVAFVQDEYRETARVCNALGHMNISLLFSLLSETDADLVYPKSILPDLTIVRLLAGYVQRDLLTLNVPRICDRKIDVSYRARKMPIWLGELAFEKWQIADQFIRHATASKILSKMRIDVSTREADRLYGGEWINLLKNSKCVLGVESGSNVLDRTGSIRENVERACHLKVMSEAEIYDEYVRQHDNILHMNQISPRHFESCALGTVQILFKGEYSGVMAPDRHYIALNHDFSNFDEVEKILADLDRLNEISATARKEVAENPLWSYEAMGNIVSSSITELLKKSGRDKPVARISRNYFRYLTLTSLSYALYLLLASSLNQLLRVRLIRGCLFSIWYHLSPTMQVRIRPLLSLFGR
jgi:hypothetical protein